MFVNINDTSLDITASSTPTAYALPAQMVRIRVLNKAGDSVVLKLETSSTSTLTAPVVGTKYSGTTIADGSTEVFDVNPNTTHISVYSASGTGTVTVQSHGGE